MPLSRLLSDWETTSFHTDDTRRTLLIAWASPLEIPNFPGATWPGYGTLRVAALLGFVKGKRQINQKESRCDCHGWLAATRYELLGDIKRYLTGCAVSNGSARSALRGFSNFFGGGGNSLLLQCSSELHGSRLAVCLAPLAEVCLGHSPISSRAFLPHLLSARQFCQLGCFPAATPLAVLLLLLHF